MGKYYLAIDLGTSTLKATLYNSAFNPVSRVTTENNTYYPKPTWAEQDPNEWWRNTVDIVKRMLNDANISGDEIAGIGTCGQSNGVILVDKNCRPLYNSLIWPDMRAIVQAEKIRQGGVKELSVGPIVPYFSAAKLYWLKENKPEIFEEAYKFLLPKDFIRTKMTGTPFVTDLRDVLATQLYDPDTMSWSKKVLEIIDIPERILPEIHQSQEIVGEVSVEAAKETGLKENTPVIAGCGNGSLEPVMKALNLENSMIVYLGSAPIILAYTPRLVGPARRPHYLGGALSANGGALIKWFKEQFGSIEKETAKRTNANTYTLLDKGAAAIEPGSGGLLFLPHMMGERQYLGELNLHAKGVLFGLSLGHTRTHIYRSVLEGVGYQLRTVFDTIKKQDPDLEIERILVFGGGSKSKIWRQIIADIIGIPVNLLNKQETASLNLACLISLGLGVHKDMKEIVEKLDLRVISEEPPSLEHKKKYDQLYTMYKNLEETLKPTFSYTYTNLREFYW